MRTVLFNIVFWTCVVFATALAVSAGAQGDVMGLAAFALMGVIPVMWYGSIKRAVTR